MTADMPSEFWAGWIIALTVVSVLGLLWLIFSIYFISDKEQQEVSPVWDSNLREGFSAAPMWWFWMILIALIISVIYLMLYPGLGSFSGILKWSQGGRLEQSFVSYNEKFLANREKIAASSLVELKQNKLAMDSARRIFTQNCAMCHGPQGEGQAFAFPNLRDRDWQWGSSEEAIMQSIRQGRKAIMIGWESALGKEGVSQVSDYVLSLANKDNSSVQTPGAELYQQYCVACHGQQGEGNSVLGAPNLADAVWLYGGTKEDIWTTVAHGRNGIMPAFEHRLDEAQIKMLAAWLIP